MKAILTVEDLRVAWPGGQAVLDGVSSLPGCGQADGHYRPQRRGARAPCAWPRRGLSPPASR